MNRASRRNIPPFGGLILLACLAWGVAWWRHELASRENHHAVCSHAASKSSCPIEISFVNSEKRQ